MSLQAAAWLARVATAWCFLWAFGIDASTQNALLVVMIQGAGSLFTLTSGGVGPKQALMVVIFADQASSSSVLAFSAGMEVILVVFQAVIGIAVAVRMLDGTRLSDGLGRTALSRRDQENA